MPLVALNHAARRLVGLPKEKRLEASYALAEDFGIISGSGLHSLMAARTMGGDPVGRWQSDQINRYFRGVGLEQLTNYTRALAVSSAVMTIRRAARTIRGDRGGWLVGGPKLARQTLKELGLQDADMDRFVEWAAALEEVPHPNQVPAEHLAVYQTMLRRFSDQSVMRPDATSRPRWANSPIGGVVYGLQSFAYEFTKSVLGRQRRVVQRAVDRQQDLDMGDRVALLMPVLTTVPMLAVAQFALSAGRDELDKEMKESFGGTVTPRYMTQWAQFERALSRAGAFGSTDVFYNMLTGSRFGRDPIDTLVGPTIGAASDAASEGVSLLMNNSPNTNAAERNVAQTSYELGVEPLANLLLNAGPASPLNFLARQAVRYSKDAYVDETAGAASSRRPTTVEGILDRVSPSRPERVQ